MRQVAIAPLYGGRLLSEWLPLVEVSSEHAGRLTDFSTGRSDLRYLATDLAPYLLSILGVPLLRLATRRRSAFWVGAALVLALAPFMSLAGDYYEIGSILVTRAASPLEPPPEPYSGAAVCACLMLAGELDEVEITTIEGLAARDEAGQPKRHPVQQALIEAGGTQCGFCTPGIVMLAVALLSENPRPSDDEIRHAIAGNICRCTGYEKIIRAIAAAAQAETNA